MYNFARKKKNKTFFLNLREYDSLLHRLSVRKSVVITKFVSKVRVL